MFELIPAIDLRNGRVVRLRQGDFGRETVYGDDPIAVARAFVASGARWLHLVDLDGAASGGSRQWGLIERIVRSVGDAATCQVAGGLRDAGAVAAALAVGAGRVVVGTAALHDPGFAARLVGAHGPDRIVVALDVRDGLAVGAGWADGAAGVPVEEALDALAGRGVEIFAATSIARDGTLEGPDTDLLARLLAARRGAIIASGGIASMPDIRAVRAAGCRGVIVGRALYEGRIVLAEAVAETDAGPAPGN